MKITNTDLEEGERFVDEAEKPIPPQNTWDELTTNQLIDVQHQLEEAEWAFARNPVISRTVKEGLVRIRALIASRSS
jgi:hypothetical protein